MKADCSVPLGVYAEFQGETVTAAEEIEDGKTEYTSYTPAVSGTPGELTLENFLKTAMMPVGTTLYIYGGGWNWQDDGSAVQTRTIGVSPDWVRFFEEQDENFTYKGKDGDEENVDASASYYPFGGYNEYYYAGLDCSGYVGWVIYNTFETENGKEGYVGGSTGFAKRLADQGLGTWTQDVAGPDAPVILPGDIMSLNGHVLKCGTVDVILGIEHSLICKRCGACLYRGKRRFERYRKDVIVKACDLDVLARNKTSLSAYVISAYCH